MFLGHHALHGLLFLVLATPAAQAALDVGDQAPDFSTVAARAGKQFQFSLSSALTKGPVVLYFFPAAFSDGCSIEAHAFAEAIAEFESLGAIVVGVSRDDIDVLSRFSVQACNGKFAVASDESLAIAKSFDATMQLRADYANRISYVISPAGRVTYSYMSLDPTRHVSNTLAALRDLKQRMSSSNERASLYQRAIYPVSAATGANVPPASGARDGKSAYSRWAIVVSVPISSSDFERAAKPMPAQ